MKFKIGTKYKFVYPNEPVFDDILTVKNIKDSIVFWDDGSWSDINKLDSANIQEET